MFILILCRFKLQFAKEKLTERLTKIRAMIVGCRARERGIVECGVITAECRVCSRGWSVESGVWSV